MPDRVLIAYALIVLGIAGTIGVGLRMRYMSRDNVIRRQRERDRD